MTSNQLGEDTIQRIAVVTGAARGIGRAIAERLTSDGHRLVLFDRDEAELSQVAERLAASLMIVGDVTTQTDLDRLLQQTAEVAGPIGILVNNVGTAGKTASIEEQSDDDWQAVLDVLLTAPFRWSRAVVPIMRAEGWGRIINIASVAGKEGNPRLIPYSAAKAGLIGMTKALSREVCDAGILVNAVAPAVIETQLFEVIPYPQQQYMLSKIPLGRSGTPAEVAAAVSFLVSEATFTTGQTLDLSGGRCTY